MNPIEAKEILRASRWRLLGSLATAAGVSTAAMMGMNSPVVLAAGGEPEVPEEIFGLSRLRNYKNLRSSSWDRTGGNDDSVGVDPGRAATVLDVHGAGVVTHLVHHQFTRSRALKESGPSRLVGRRTDALR